MAAIEPQSQSQAQSLAKSKSTRTIAPAHLGTKLHTQAHPIGNTMISPNMNIQMINTPAVEIPMYSKLIGALCAHEEQRAAAAQSNTSHHKRRRTCTQPMHINHLTTFSLRPIATASPPTEMDSISDSDESILSEDGSWSCLDSGDDHSRPAVSREVRKKRRGSTSSSSSIGIGGSNNYTQKLLPPLPKCNPATSPTINFSTIVGNLSFTRNTYVSPTLKPQVPEWDHKKLSPLSLISPQSEALFSLLQMANAEREKLKHFALEIEAASRSNIFVPNRVLSPIENGNSICSVKSTDTGFPSACSELQTQLQSEKNIANPIIASASPRSSAVTVEGTSETSRLSIIATPLITSRQPLALPLVANTNTSRATNLVSASTAIPATTVRATPATVSTINSSTESALPASVLSSRVMASSGVPTHAIPAIAISATSKLPNVNKKSKKSLKVESSKSVRKE